MRKQKLNYLYFALALLSFGSANATVYTVSNTNNSGGGSLDQAIIDANGGGGGSHTIRFNIPTSDPNYDAGRGVFTITLTSDLSKLTIADVTIDGTTQTAFTGNTNSGMLGTGGTVGRLATTLDQVNAPEIEIKSDGGRDYGIWVDADNITIRGLAVYGFGTDYLNDEHSQILIGSFGSSKGTALIEQCVLGAKADTYADPTPTINDGRGACFLSIDNITFQNNLVGYVEAAGIAIKDGCTNIVIDQNEFRNCGLNSLWYDGVDIGLNSVTATVTENLVSNNGACGIESWQVSGGVDILRNTIELSGQSPVANESSGIRLTGTGNLIENNIIKDGAAQGIIILGLTGAPHTPTTQTKISKNNIYNNQGMAIDLLASGADPILGDGITPNSGAPNACGTTADHGNDGLDFPVISTADHDPVSGNATITGQACPNSTIELYVAQAGAGDNDGTDNYGEGGTYVATTTTDGSGNFSFVGTGFNGGQDVTALVIDGSDNTSEFSKNVFLKSYELCGNGIDDNGDGRIDEAIPGGVSSNIALWLKADAGVKNGASTAIDGQAVNTWEDQSGVRTKDAADNQYDQPIYRNNVSDNINFNPVIDFDGTDDGLDFNSDYIFSSGTGSEDGMTWFVIVEPDAAPATKSTQYIFDFGWWGDEGYGFCYGDDNVRKYTPSSFGGALGNTTHTRGTQTTLSTVVVDFGNQQDCFLDGSSTAIISTAITITALTAAEINESPTTTSGNNGPFTIGHQSKSSNLANDNGRMLDGSIAEMIGYSKVLSLTEKQKVESYLALKYGISLAHDYFDSQGSLIKNVNDGYNEGIASIGRDDHSGLLQARSRSLDDIISMELLDEKAMNDRSFLTWGFRRPSRPSPSLHQSNIELFDKKIWKVEEKGQIGLVKIKVHDHDFKYVVVSESENFEEFEILELSNEHSITTDLQGINYFVLSKEMILPLIVSR